MSAPVNRRFEDLPKEVVERIIFHLWKPPSTYSGKYYDVPKNWPTRDKDIIALAGSCQKLRKHCLPAIWGWVALALDFTIAFNHKLERYSNESLPLKPRLIDPDNRYINLLLYSRDANC